MSLAHILQVVLNQASMPASTASRAYGITPQNFPEPRFKFFGPADLTFPNNCYTPTGRLQLFSIFPVPCDVAFKFLLPERNIALWRVGVLASLVPMPEASMHKDDSSASRKDNIRPARKILSMKPEPITTPVQQ